MVRWGFYLFQSDHDLDTLAYLAREAGVESLYFPEDPKAVRETLEKDGKLSVMFDRWQERNEEDVFGITPKYSTVILGAAAMTLGAKIEERHLQLLGCIYETAGLYEDGQRQMRDALARYKNDGTPYDFEQCLDLIATANAKVSGKASTFCGNCNKSNVAKKCGGCHRVSYCDKDCQKADWKFHKRRCNKPSGRGASSTGCFTMLNADPFNAMRSYS
ncbi:MAG: hypothetical protein M1820_007613 [Bogoriella megaspora]|nr:MAG: hypothetical protein M1820_007613 [Bogoriella megaspora]